jgi:hypothetical protein
MRFKQRNAPIELSGHEPGGLYERWQELTIRLLEIRILERAGLDADTACELRENAYTFVRFDQPMASLPRQVPANK